MFTLEYTLTKPVNIFFIFPGLEQDLTEQIRRKALSGIEYGPNATWSSFPKTKLLFQAATNNDIDRAKEVIDESNIDAYGTCKVWTPLHVTAFYGSHGKHSN